MPLLIINRSDSRCGECGKSCDPRERSHQSVLGYGPLRGTPGCGAVWDQVTSHYVGDDIKERVRAMRPDLEWVAWA